MSQWLHILTCKSCREKYVMKRKKRIKVWVATDCEEFTTGSLRESHETPYLVFKEKQNAERRQGLIVGKVRRATLIMG